VLFKKPISDHHNICRSCAPAYKLQYVANSRLDAVPSDHSLLWTVEAIVLFCQHVAYRGWSLDSVWHCLSLQAVTSYDKYYYYQWANTQGTIQDKIQILCTLVEQQREIQLRTLYTTAVTVLVQWSRCTVLSSLWAGIKCATIYSFQFSQHTLLHSSWNDRW